jgi:putative transposase
VGGDPLDCREVGVFRPGEARPLSEVMVRFMDEHWATYGVEPICAVLRIAPSVYYEHKLWQREPPRRPAQARRGPRRPHPSGVEQDFEVYGVRKVWRHLVIVLGVSANSARVSEKGSAHALS